MAAVVCPLPNNSSAAIVSRPHPPPTPLPVEGLRLPLPPEIFLFALQSLSAPDLATCLRVNSGFAHLSLPLLYEHVRLSEHGAWPVYDDRAVPGPLTRERPYFLARGPLVQRTRRVDLYPHSTERCRRLPGGWGHTLPPLPKLQVLRIFLGTFWSGRRIYHTNVDPHDAAARPGTLCAALYLVHAPTLVVRGLTFSHSTVPRHELSRTLEDSVRHYIAVFEPDAPFILPRNGLAAARAAATHFRQRLPAYLSHLTLVFHLPRGNWRHGAVTLSWALVHAFASALWAQVVAWACRGGGGGRLTIVNAGALAAGDGEEAPSAGACAALQAAVRREFVAAISERMGDQAPRVLDNIEFLTMNEYLATAEAADVFDAGEVA
ncbi:hypothetical protein CC85DRAFT_92687 [Cutaneotrichosporon oleaginosum]|uniref:F-box domain-containing protein n=1 Tax=Cutaneotrichosporon oleaginosum TaxID=879819 RepID=A0A0J0XMN8_9TREE|nr:uncharacterized protein CC85DRAFT_92687 [Cutaneotrichosporon oleaginosum]KLT42357.1 hypothetical protein CC85DRAFT_92687 [Cutaneotrichosporon oleaginosum]TXT04177.1 hypothetical protein COLE_07874 [Cutaneotrichosporon oleaginosum]